MKLPNGVRAIVDIRKLEGYCLDPQHPHGRNKARVFASVGIRRADAEELRIALLAAASGAEAGRVLPIRMDSAISSTSIWSAKTER
jgi:hypothetical protein